MATHSRTLAWRIPWTDEPGGLQSLGHKESDRTDLDTHKPLMRTDTARHLDQGPEHMTHEARLRIPDPRENKHVI